MLKQATVQLTPETQRQLDDLRSAGFGKLTNVTREAIARMWRDECGDAPSLAAEVRRLNEDNIALLARIEAMRAVLVDAEQEVQP